jgi:hypothetical protein
MFSNRRTSSLACPLGRTPPCPQQSLRGTPRSISASAPLADPVPLPWSGRSASKRHPVPAHVSSGHRVGDRPAVVAADGEAGPAVGHGPHQQRPPRPVEAQAPGTAAPRPCPGFWPFSLCPPATAGLSRLWQATPGVLWARRTGRCAANDVACFSAGVSGRLAGCPPSERRSIPATTRTVWPGARGVRPSACPGGALAALINPRNPAKIS